MKVNVDPWPTWLHELLGQRQAKPRALLLGISQGRPFRGVPRPHAAAGARSAGPEVDDLEAEPPLAQARAIPQRIAEGAVKKASRDADEGEWLKRDGQDVADR